MTLFVGDPAPITDGAFLEFGGPVTAGQATQPPCFDSLRPHMTARNWREYFTERFGTDPRFVVKTSNGSMLVTSSGSGTEIEIRYTSLDEIHDVDFLNQQSPGWCRWVTREREIGEGFYPGERTFTAENIARVEEWLAIPLHQGWTEDAFYLGGKHVKSKLRWKQGDKVVQTTEYMQHVGCLLSLFQAIRYSERLGGRRMQSRTIVIKPMIEAV